MDVFPYRLEISVILENIERMTIKNGILVSSDTCKSILMSLHVEVFHAKGKLEIILSLSCSVL